MAGDEGGVSHAQIFASIQDMRREVMGGINRAHERVDQVNDMVGLVRVEAARQAETLSHLQVIQDQAAHERKSANAAFEARLKALERPVQTARLICWIVGGIFTIIVTIIGIIPGVRALASMIRGEG